MSYLLTNGSSTRRDIQLTIMNDVKEGNPLQEKYIYLLGAKRIVFIAPFVPITGSINAALFLSQLLYWGNKGSDPQWIYKTIEEFYGETGLTREKQQTAIDKLKHLGVLEQENRGMPPKRHFRINHDKLKELCQKYISTRIKPTFDGSDTLNKNAGITQNNTYTTPQSTSNNTGIDLSARTTNVVLADANRLEGYKDRMLPDAREVEEELGLPLRDYIFSPPRFWTLQKAYPTLTSDQIADTIENCVLAIGSQPDRIPCKSLQMFEYHVDRFLKSTIKRNVEIYY